MLDALLLPVEAGLSGWPQLRLDAAQADCLGHGRELHLALPAVPAGDAVAVGPDGRALGLVEVGDAGRVRAKRLFRWAARGQGARA